MKLTRRHFLGGIGMAGAAGLAALRPADHGAAHTAYFLQLQTLLQQQGSGTPTLLLDLDLLDANIHALQQLLKPQAAYRLVVKSLSSAALIDYVLRKTGSQRLMCFHLPFLQQCAAQFPQADILLGKPLPIQAARQFVAHAPVGALPRVQWLVNNHDRLLQYRQLAAQTGTPLRINIELDVGLHRGGVSDPHQLAAMLREITAAPKLLSFSGFMGYDAHVGKIPGALQSAEQSYQQSQQRYSDAIALLRQQAPALLDQTPLTFNGAGSATLHWHRRQSVCNDLSAGSCLLKPGDFEVTGLEKFVPAAFIAAPVLKRLDGTRIPGIEHLAGPMAWWDRNLQQSWFIYGGKWLARYVSPPGLQDNALYGSSSNQSIVTGSKQIRLGVDDWVFLRPDQSEAVLLQFGDLLVHRSGQFVARWPVLQQSA
jgi:D-serine deaminase-like pyridoxal phosphate-dependent protein